MPFLPPYPIGIGLAILLTCSFTAAAQDRPFQDEYSELDWRASGESNVFAEAFRMAGVNHWQAGHRGRQVWRLWCGVDRYGSEQVADLDALQTKWDQSDIIDLLEFGFEHAGRGISATPRESAEAAWLRMHHLLPDDALPTDVNAAVEEAARSLDGPMQRFVVSLSLSPEQTHAVALAVERMQVRHVAYVRDRFARFAEARQHLDRRLAKQELFAGDRAEPPMYRRDRIRLDAFDRTRNSGVISATAYSGDLLRELLKAYQAFRSDVEQNRSSEQVVFLADVEPLLTPEQAALLPAATVAYDIGWYIDSRRFDGASWDGFIALRLDARLLLSHELESGRSVPPMVREWRAELGAVNPQRDPTFRSVINRLVADYELHWAETLAQTEELIEGRDPLMTLYRRLVNPGNAYHLRTEAHMQRDMQYLSKTVQFIRDVSSLLRRHEYPALAEQWDAMCNRLIHSTAYPIWESLDMTDEFHNAREKAREAGDDESAEALAVLESEYAAERRAEEPRLQAVSLQLGIVQLEVRPAASLWEAGKAFADFLEYARNQRSRYREQIALRLPRHDK